MSGGYGSRLVHVFTVAFYFVFCMIFSGFSASILKHGSNVCGRIYFKRFSWLHFQSFSYFHGGPLHFYSWSFQLYRYDVTILVMQVYTCWFRVCVYCLHQTKILLRLCIAHGCISYFTASSLHFLAVTAELYQQDVSI